MYEVVERKDAVLEKLVNWTIMIVLHYFDGTSREVACFRDDERELADRVCEFLNATASITTCA